MDAGMRIGELSRRTGVSPELLRAWEQRYSLLRPHRSPGGFRLYTAADEARVRRTTALIAEGLSAAEAARAATTESPETDQGPQLLDSLRGELQRALDDFDGTAAHLVMDRLFSTFSVTSVVAEVLIPYLRDLGERWAAGSVTVAQEHFASHLLRGRLLGAAGDWGEGGPSSALLACLPGEAHDLGLVLFGVLLSRRGWRITFLGADTPFETLEAGVRSIRPRVVVLTTLDQGRFREHTEAIRRLASLARVAVAAPVDGQSVRDLGAYPLPRGIEEAARWLAGHPDLDPTAP